jgi:hypothetical protein
MSHYGVKECKKEWNLRSIEHYMSDQYVLIDWSHPLNERAEYFTQVWNLSLIKQSLCLIRQGLDRQKKAAAYFFIFTFFLLNQVYCPYAA